MAAGVVHLKILGKSGRLLTDAIPTIGHVFKPAVRLHTTWDHSPVNTGSNGADAICAVGAGHIHGGIHSAVHPAGATVVDVIDCMGLTALSSVVAAVLVPGTKKAGGEVLTVSLQVSERSAPARQCTNQTTFWPASH
jgi:hypothetical protein